MIIYYAGLMSIPDDVYETAQLDGCGFWNTLFRVTVPMLSGTTNTLIVLGIVRSLKTIDIVIQTTGGGPAARRNSSIRTCISLASNSLMVDYPQQLAS